MPEDFPPSASSASPAACDAAAADMTPEQLAEAKEYGRRELHLLPADKALDLVFLALVAVFWPGRWTSGCTGPGRCGSPALRLAVFF